MTNPRIIVLEAPEEKRRRLAAELGLPPTADEADIHIALSLQSMRNAAIELGLPPDTRRRVIKRARIERRRKRLAAEVGLPETATIEEIRAEHRRQREAAAAILGVPVGDVPTAQRLLIAGGKLPGRKL